MKSVIRLASTALLLPSFASGFQPTRASGAQRTTAKIVAIQKPAWPTQQLFVQNNSYQDWDTDYIEEDDENNKYQQQYYYRDDYDYEPLQENRQLIETTNTVLKAAHGSFKHVEGMANYLLQENPVVAFGIFVSAGLFVAYGMGFFMLDGDMESINPAANGAVPYWDEEILVMTRKIH